MEKTLSEGAVEAGIATCRYLLALALGTREQDEGFESQAFSWELP